MDDSHSKNTDNPRRCLTDEEFRQIVEEAAQIASRRATEHALDTLLPEGVFNMFMDHLERQVGRSIIRKGLWAVGIAVAAIGAIFTAWIKGWLKV